MIIRILACVLALFAGLIALIWSMPPPSFDRDPARNLPWNLPDHRLAEYQITELDDGRIKIRIEHLPLKGVTPEMLAWFYQNLPISTVTLEGNDYPLYHLFHPTEHGRVSVLEPAVDGSDGMGEGALIRRQEWFGDFNSQGEGRVIKLSDQGMTVKPEKFGLHFGLIQHKFEATESGARYQLNSIIGSDLPVLGGLINAFIKHKMIPEEMRESWVRHQIEEVGSLQFFLPQLFSIATTGEHKNHYPLSL